VLDVNVVYELVFIYACYYAFIIPFLETCNISLIVIIFIAYFC